MPVEAEQEQELRQWAASLSGADVPERRAMGRAMLMLLGQIDSLRADLERERSRYEPVAADGPPAEPIGADSSEHGDAPAPPAEETTAVGLRDRLRGAAHRKHR